MAASVLTLPAKREDWVARLKFAVAAMKAGYRAPVVRLKREG